MNGWAPASVTYGADGELISVTVTEPRFTPDERALLLAARRSAMTPRGEHGFTIAEATDPANQYAFRVPQPLTDFAAKALADAKRKYAKQWGNDALDGTLWSVELRN